MNNFDENSRNSLDFIFQRNIEIQFGKTYELSCNCGSVTSFKLNI